MALPTTNLTFHFDASNNDDVIKTGSTSAVDGENVEEWEDDDGKDLSFYATNGPTYKTVTPLMPLSCLDFNGSDERQTLYNSAGDTVKRLSNVFTASAKTLLISLYVKSITLNDAGPYANHGVFADCNTYFGVHLRTSGGVHTLQCYNYDGNADKTEHTILLNTPYVLMYRHDGTNIYSSINGGGETIVASGATATLTGQIVIGTNGDGADGTGPAYADIRLGEIAGYNVDLAGQSTDLATAISHFNSRWLSGGSSGGGSRIFSGSGGNDFTKNEGFFRNQN